MPHIELRTQPGTRSANDLVVSVQDATFEYLMTSSASDIRVSTYLDQDCPQVESRYREVFVHDDCRFQSQITKVIPGSRTRKNIVLPGPMFMGEQLVVLVTRTPIEDL